MADDDPLEYHSPPYRSFAADVVLAILLLWLLALVFAPGEAMGQWKLAALAIAVTFLLDRAIGRSQSYTLRVEPEGLRFIPDKPLRWLRVERLIEWERIKRVRVWPLAYQGRRAVTLVLKRKVKFLSMKWSWERPYVPLPVEIAGDERFIAAVLERTAEGVCPVNLEERLSRAGTFEKISRVLRIAAGLVGCVSIVGMLVTYVAPHAPDVLTEHPFGLMATAALSCVGLSMMRVFKMRTGIYDRAVNVLILPNPLVLIFVLFSVRPGVEWMMVVYLSLGAALMGGSAVEEAFGGLKKSGTAASAAVGMAILAICVGTYFSVSVPAHMVGEGELIGLPWNSPWTGDDSFFASVRETEDAWYLDWHGRGGELTCSVKLPGQSYLLAVAGAHAVVSVKDRDEYVLIDTNGQTRMVRLENPGALGLRSACRPTGRRCCCRWGTTGLRSGYWTWRRARCRSLRCLTGWLRATLRDGRRTAGCWRSRIRRTWSSDARRSGTSRGGSGSGMIRERRRGSSG